MEEKNGKNASTTPRKLANQRPSSHWAYLTKQLQFSSQKFTSGLHCLLQVHFSVHINVLCLTVILTVKFIILEFRQ